MHYGAIRGIKKHILTSYILTHKVIDFKVIVTSYLLTKASSAQ